MITRFPCVSLEGTLESSGIVTHFYSRRWVGEWLASSPGALPLREDPRPSLNRRMGGAQNHPGRFGEKSVSLPDVEPRFDGCFSP